MKQYGLLGLTVVSPLVMIWSLFTARVSYKNYYFLNNLYTGDLAKQSIGAPSGEFYKMWLALGLAVICLVIFVIALIKYLKMKSKSK